MRGGNLPGRPQAKGLCAGEKTGKKSSACACVHWARRATTSLLAPERRETAGTLFALEHPLLLGRVLRQCRWAWHHAR